MKNFNMRKRIASAAAAVVLSASFIGMGFTSNHAPFTYSQGAPIIAVAAESTVKFISTQGYGEAMYAKWFPVSGASGYNVYVDGKQIDSMLIRQYNGFMRADAVGLTAGIHTMKVVPVTGGKEDTSKADETIASVYAHDRSGYGWVNGTSSGAYNEDGTLKSNAVVVYVTNQNKDSVTAMINAEGKGEVSCVGIQNIITAYKKGKETRPLCVRLIGNIEDPANMPKGDLMLDTVTAGMTIEGIGNDATCNGFGIVLKNCSNVEVRNIAFMNCNSDEGDDCGLQQGNDHCWVHNCDFFYGDAGSDADQVKGDGALDTKKSLYITHSYNHFWDNGKCNLQGANASDTSNFITYHHNWYDHSDSRHPRVRVATVHVYNNYYDGNAKYGIGSTTGSSVFSENNFFRNCKEPMLISKQGSEGGLVLSGEDGGMIKAYGNVIIGAEKFVSYSENNTDFDAYVASSRDEQVPSSVKSKAGGNTYNNFDTASGFYSYKVDSAEDVPTIVTAKAGRVDGGDFQWQFDNSVDDASYAVNAPLKAALVAYKDSIVAVGSGFKEDTGTVQPTTSAQQTTQTPQTTASPQPTTQTTQPTTNQTPVTGADVIYASPNGGGDGSSMDKPTTVTAAISSVKAGGTIYLLGGTYKFSEMITIDSSNSGKAGAYKTISAYPGAEVVWDFSGQGDANDSKRGVALRGSYWRFYGFEITKAADNGMLLAGNNNIIEMMEFNDNQDTGLQISRYDSSQATIADWPSNNLILNCTAKNNCDNKTMENADGFAAKLTCGQGNVFDGCMSYNNSDDGWDLFAKTETGPIGVVTLRNCIAFRNGFTEFGEGYGDCDGNGFKLGGSGVGSAHVVENCLAFENLNCGFTDNNNPLLGSLKDCTSYNNGVGGNGKPNVSCYRCTDTTTLFTNVMSYINTSKVSSLGANGIKVSNDKLVGKAANTIYYNSKYYYAKSETMTNGAKLGDIITPADSDFITLSVPAMGTDFHKTWRNADGSPNPAGFAETPSNGTYASVGYHMYNGTTQPQVTTAQTTSGGTTEQTETTAKPVETTSPVVSGGYVHNFTANGASSSFYTITGNLSTAKGTVNYAGLTLTQCLKLESATSITFDAPSSGKLTLVFAEPAATIKVDGTKYTSSGDGIITVDLSAGSHTVAKADTANLFYMVYSDEGAQTTTETTTSQPENIVYGDANEDGKVDITDVVAVMCHASNSTAFPFTEKQIDNCDVYQRGDGISTSDATSIQKYLVKFIISLPE